MEDLITSLKYTHFMQFSSSKIGNEKAVCYIKESEHNRIVSELENKIESLNEKIGECLDKLVKKQDEIIELSTNNFNRKVKLPFSCSKSEDPLETCTMCNGTGEYREEHGIVESIEACPGCGGDGYIRKSKIENS